MAIQVVGFSDSGIRKYTTVLSVRDIFASPSSVLAQIPLPEQLNVNLKYSLFSDNSQEFMPIRITELQDSDVEHAQKIVAQCLNVDVGHLLMQRWGTTLEILVQLKKVIQPEEYTNGFFDHKKESYRRLVTEIFTELKDVGVDVNVDIDVFNRDTYFPLPGAHNVSILNDTCEPVDLDLEKRENKFLKALSLFGDFKSKEEPVETKQERGAPIIRGFRIQNLTKDGVEKPGPIALKALLKAFDKKFGHLSLKESKIVYRFTGKFWEIMHPNELGAYCEEMVVPAPLNNECAEFREKIYRTNLIEHTWFGETTFKKINFQNGVLDLETMELLPHSRSFGFLYILPYNYDPQAVSPHFDRHLSDITCGDQDLQKILMEYAGYAISNDPVWEQKCLIMLGGGRNGKSTFIRVLQKLVGEKNYCALSIDDFNKEQYVANIEGRLFNISEETPNKIYQSNKFKNIVGGGTVMIKRLYSQPYPIQARIKTIIACNEMPQSKDATDGFFRRLLIVPFDNNFDEDTRDVFIDQKLEKELPGILNKALIGYKRLHEQKKFTASAKSTEVKHDYMETTDIVRIWLERVSVEFTGDEKHFVSCEHIYQSYINMCEAYGEKPTTMNGFAMRLVALRPQFKSLRERRRIGSKNHRGYFKVRIFTGELDQPTYL